MISVFQEHIINGLLSRTPYAVKAEFLLGLVMVTAFLLFNDIFL